VPTGLFWTYDTLAMRSDMAAATMLEKLPKTGSPVQTLRLGGRALVLDFKGNYEGIGEAHNAIEDCMLDRKLRLVPPVIEEYHSGPQTEPDTTLWMTRIIYYVTDSIPPPPPIVGKPKR
jgi:Transcriptional regulator, effector-binding domain/component